MTFPAYASYRDTGVELIDSIPSSWALERLKRIARLNPSKSEIGHLDDDAELSFLPMEAIGETGEVDASRTRPLGEVRNGYSYFANGDVVLAKVTPCFENGKGALLDGLVGGRGFGTTELTVLRPDDPADAPFLRWLVFSDFFRGPGSGEMLGAGGLKRVPDDFVANFPVPLPSPAERRGIAAFLDRETAKIDSLVAEQRRLIELLKEKRQAVISHAVTKGLNPDALMKDSGVDWLGDVPAHWEMVAIKRLIRLQSGESLTSEDIEPEGAFPVYGGNGLRGYRDKFTHDGDYVLIGRQGALCGNINYASGRFWASEHALVAHPRGFFVTRWLGELLQTMNLGRYSTSAAQPGLSAEVIGNLCIPLPPADEQSAIARLVEQTEQSIDPLLIAAELADTYLQERRAALISAAVTGKIDVRGAVARQEEAA